MTVRVAEFLLAALMAAFSGYLMYKSAELPIGWIKGQGPGAGAWPFWLATVMLLSCLGMLVNWVRKKSPPSQNTEPFFAPGVFKEVGGVALLLTITIGMFETLGTYVALFFFMFVYIGIIGRHGWGKALFAAVVTPVATFFFFEILVKVIMPKGITEPFFLPIFKFFGMGGL